jgi:OOP family OmpA-OmpF porin
VLFDYDRSALRPRESAKLDELVTKMKGRPSDRLDAVGHADRIGANAYNTGLSKRRAEAVQAYLVSKGFDAGRIRADAKGEDESVTGDACRNMGPENRTNQKLVECLQRDRRVEVRLVAKP